MTALPINNKIFLEKYMNIYQVKDRLKIIVCCDICSREFRMYSWYTHCITNIHMKHVRYLRKLDKLP